MAAIDAIEAVTKHDVIAFLTWVAENVGDEARFMHQGMTSSDVLDTRLAVQLSQAADILLADLDALLPRSNAGRLNINGPRRSGAAMEFMPEPVTFGLKLAEAYAEFSRCKARPRPRARDSTCAISGAVGTLPTSIRASKRVARNSVWRNRARVDAGYPARPPCDLLRRARSDRPSIERLAVEVRHLQRTEVLEAEEYFSPASVRRRCRTAQPRAHRKPHWPGAHGAKRHHSRDENVALWHERDDQPFVGRTLHRS